MTDSYEFYEGVFQHVVLKGSACEVGQQQAALVKGTPLVANYLSGEAEPSAGLGQTAFLELQKQYEAFCPGINDEIQGFADELGVPARRMKFYGDSFCNPPNCAQMVALPSITAEGHTLVGRSYEWTNAESELRLCATAIEGHFATLGFSVLMFGRWDGMNSAGLSVTSSAGTGAGMPEDWIKVKGFNAWFAIRAILEHCATVADALVILREAPIDYVNLIVAEKAGRAAKVEVAGKRRSVVEIDHRTPQASLVATNHYTLPGMLDLNTFEGTLGHSRPRYQAIEACLQQDAPGISIDTLRNILSREFPNGCFCPYYRYYLGTLWSEIFDLTAGQAEVCFGSPGYNDWHVFSLAGEPRMDEYRVKFAQKI